MGSACSGDSNRTDKKRPSEIDVRGRPEVKVSSPEEPLEARLSRRLTRWRLTQEVSHYNDLKYREPFKPQITSNPGNRFPELGAYEDAVVKVPGVAYYNATPISLDCDDWRWIAAMCPRQAIIGHFWMTVWEYKCPLIINLTGPHDLTGSRRSKHKKEKYWPPYSCVVDDTGWPIKVETVSTETLESNCFFSRTIVKLIHKESQEDRLVTLICYINWVDTGQVFDIDTTYFHDNASNLNLLCHIVTEMRKSFAEPDAYTLVHCSAGVGRTGTLIATLFVLDRLHELSDIKKLDCTTWNVIERIRQRRLWMVKNEFEYATIFGAVKERLRERRVDEIPDVTRLQWVSQTPGWGLDDDWLSHATDNAQFVSSPTSVVSGGHSSIFSDNSPQLFSPLSTSLSMPREFPTPTLQPEGKDLESFVRSPTIS